MNRKKAAGCDTVSPSAKRKMVPSDQLAPVCFSPRMLGKSWRLSARFREGVSRNRLPWAIFRSPTRTSGLPVTPAGSLLLTRLPTESGTLWPAPGFLLAKVRCTGCRPRLRISFRCCSPSGRLPIPPDPTTGRLWRTTSGTAQAFRPVMHSTEALSKRLA